MQQTNHDLEYIVPAAALLIVVALGSWHVAPLAAERAYRNTIDLSPISRLGLALFATGLVAAIAKTIDDYRGQDR